MRKLTSVLSIQATCVLIALFAGCKGIETDDRTEQQDTPLPEPATETSVEIPLNGAILSDYSELKGKAQLLSVSFPSPNGVFGLSATEEASDAAGEDQGGLLLTSTTVSGSVIDQIGPKFSQGTVRTPQFVLVTVAPGRSSVVVYVNSTIGYYIPSSGDLANCFDVKAPVSDASLGFVDCVPVGQISSIIPSGSRYANGNYIRNGNTYYYEDGRTFLSSRAYYNNGTTLYNGSTFYWANGSTLASTRVYFPGGSTWGASTTYYPSGTTHISSSGTVYYSNGSTQSNSTYYYPTGSRLASSGGTYYYPSGSTMRNTSGQLYGLNGQTISSVVESYSYPTSTVRLEARFQGAWIGITNRIPSSSFDFVAMNSLQAGNLYTGTGAVEVPPFPSNLTLASVQGNTVNLAWASGGGTTQGYLVKKIENPVGFLPTCAGGVRLTGTSYQFTNLAVDTKHAFLVCAEAASGIQSHASVILAETSNPNVPPANPTALTSDLQTESTIRLKWTGAAGAVTNYKVAFAAGLNAPANCSNGFAINGAVSATISNLQPNTNYSVRVCSTNSFGVNSAGVTVTAKTSVASPPVNPTNLRVGTITANSIQITWASGSPSTAKYKVAHARGQAPANCASAVETTLLNFQAANLLPATAYGFRVCAVNLAGQDSGGVTISETTATTSSTIATINQGAGAVGSWLSERGITGTTNIASTRRTVTTNGVTSPAPAAVYQSAREGTNFTFTQTGLVPNSRYKIRLHFAEIKAINRSGRRVFVVIANGAVVLSSVDIVALAGNRDRAVVREFFVNANASGSIVLNFVRTRNKAMVNGIEIVAAP